MPQQPAVMCAAGCIQNERQTVVLQVKDCKLHRSKTVSFIWVKAMCNSNTDVCWRQDSITAPRSPSKPTVLVMCLTRQSRTAIPFTRFHKRDLIHHLLPWIGASFELMVHRYAATSYSCSFAWNSVHNSNTPSHLQQMITSNDSRINLDARKTKGVHIVACLDRN